MVNRYIIEFESNNGVSEYIRTINAESEEIAFLKAKTLVEEQEWIEVKPYDESPVLSKAKTSAITKIVIYEHKEEG